MAFDGQGSRTFQVPSGRYALMVFAMTRDAAGHYRSTTLMGRPDLTVRSSMELRFDARQAEQVRIVTPKRADPQRYIIGWHRTVADRSALFGWVMWARTTPDVYVQRQPEVSFGTFRVTQRWMLAEPVLTVDVAGPGGFRLPTPEKVGDRTVPSYVGEDDLRVVDGGDGTPEQLAAVNSRGAAVLIRWAGPSAVKGQSEAAADAGARLVLFYNDAPGFWSTWVSGVTVPVYSLQQAEGLRLRALIPAGGAARAKVTGLRDSSYAYDLMLTDDQVNGPLTYDVARMPLAAVTTDYHRRAVPSLAVGLAARTAFVPGISAGFPVSRELVPPTRRTDYLTTSDGVEWMHSSVGDSWNLPWRGNEYSVPERYSRGERIDQEWWPALTRPAVLSAGGEEEKGTPVARFEDAIRVQIAPFVSGDGEIQGSADDRDDQVALALRRDGTEVGRADAPVARFLVPKDEAAYELEMDVRRAPDSWSTTSNHTNTVWAFRSRHVSGRQVVPLLQVGYALRTDAMNQVPRDGDTRLVLTPGYQPGAHGPGGFRLEGEVSYDEGRSWQPVRMQTGHGGQDVSATLPPAPASATTGSVRVTVRDRAGNSLVQRIDGAWLVAAD